MSAGEFQSSIYELDSGQFCRIRVQPETLALSVGGGANAAGAGPVTAGLPSARVSQSSRAFGIKPRTVSVAFTGALPDGYSGDPISRLPILTPARFNSIGVGATGTYLGVNVEVIGKSAESVR